MLLAILIGGIDMVDGRLIKVCCAIVFLGPFVVYKFDCEYPNKASLDVSFSFWGEVDVNNKIKDMLCMITSNIEGC